ncbi:hypothetical protein CL628_03285 [bacterium]|nr:hypothetical protein [bacterium]
MSSSHKPNNRHRVVILGAGFAGVRAALDLSRQSHGELDIVLVTDRDAHLDLTLLYEVATAYVRHESDISSEQIQSTVQLPLQSIFSGLEVDIVVQKVVRIDTAGQLLILADDTTIDYDTLVVAVGSSLATFDLPGVGVNTFSIKTLADALRLRHHIVRQFWQADSLAGQARKSALTFVVAGGGASGVEVAAELIGQIRRQCKRHKIDPHEITVIILEAGPRILATVTKEAAQRAHQRLTNIGVDIRLGARITEVTATEVRMQGGDYIYSRTTIWTAGLRPNPVLVDSGLPLDHWGVTVSPTLQVPTMPNIFMAGDAAVITDSEPPVPATVPVAYAQGALVAKNIRHQRRGESLEEFSYSPPGMVITLGSKVALALLPNGRYLFGLLPWLLKHFITLRYWLRLTTWGQALRLWYRSWHIHGAND